MLKCCAISANALSTANLISWVSSSTFCINSAAYKSSEFRSKSRVKKLKNSHVLHLHRHSIVRAQHLREIRPSGRDRHTETLKTKQSIFVLEPGHGPELVNLVRRPVWFQQQTEAPKKRDSEKKTPLRAKTENMSWSSSLPDDAR